MVSLLVVYQEVLHAATVMLTSEVIARVPTMGMIEPTVVYGTVSRLVVFQEVLRAATMSIFEIIAQAPTMGRTVVSAV